VCFWRQYFKTALISAIFQDVSLLSFFCWMGAFFGKSVGFVLGKMWEDFELVRSSPWESFRGHWRENCMVDS
jgi:hypothetical protein